MRKLVKIFLLLALATPDLVLSVPATCSQTLLKLSIPEVADEFIKAEGEMLIQLHLYADNHGSTEPLIHSLKHLLTEVTKHREATGKYVVAPLFKRDTSLPNLSRAEQADRKLTIKDGKFYRPDGTLFDTSKATTINHSGKPSGKQRAILVMNAEGDFFFSVTHDRGVQHANLARGEKIAFAGECEIIDGVLQSIGNRSGAYRLSSTFTLQAIESMQRQGAKFGEITVDLREERESELDGGKAIYLPLTF